LLKEPIFLSSTCDGSNNNFYQIINEILYIQKYHYPKTYCQ
jgi:hypothetical protein